MNNKKCAIILNDYPHGFKLEGYDLVIGSESGSRFVLTLEKKVNTYHIGDYDSVDEPFKERISLKENSTIIDRWDKMFSDGEEAIIYAESLGYHGSNIDIYVDTTGRKDHYSIMLNVLRKHGCTLIGNRVHITSVVPNVEQVIYKHYKYVSCFFFEEARVKTEGLRWDYDQNYTLDESTTFVSNECEGESFKIFSNKKVLLIQSQD